MSQLIVSVPHSGSRSLKKHLELKDKHVPLRHFGLHPVDEFERMASNARKVHIPIRNPIDITRSWHNRYLNEDYRVQVRLHECLDMMIEYADLWNHVALHKVEDLQQREGHHHVVPGSDMHEDMLNKRLDELRAWLPYRMDFYRDFYPELTV